MYLIVNYITFQSTNCSISLLLWIYVRFYVFQTLLLAVSMGTDVLLLPIGHFNTLRTGDADLHLYPYKQFKYPVPNVLTSELDKDSSQLHKLATCSTGEKSPIPITG
jgi:hypothetical protein